MKFREFLNTTPPVLGSPNICKIFAVTPKEIPLNAGELEATVAKTWKRRYPSELTTAKITVKKTFYSVTTFFLIMLLSS